MRKTISVIATAVTAAAAAVAIGTTTAPAANAADGDLPSGTYQPAYSQYIFDWNADTHDLHHLTFDEWQAEGAPAPIRPSASTFYARYPWSPGIVGVTFFTAPQSTDPVYYYEALTQQSWARAGNPAPEVVSDAVLPGSGVVKYRSSSELFVFDASNVFHKLNFNEWSALGSPQPVTVGEVDKYSFDSTLYLYVDATDQSPASVVALTGATWNSLANPTPYTSSGRLSGDSVFAFTDDPGTIYLRTPTKVLIHLSYPQWTALGSPQPTPVAPPGNGANATPAGKKLGTDTVTHRAGVAAVRKALGLR